MHKEVTRLATRDNGFRDPGVSATYPKNLEEASMQQPPTLCKQPFADLWRLALCKLFKKSRMTFFNVKRPLGIG